MISPNAESSANASRPGGLQNLIDLDGVSGRAETDERGLTVSRTIQVHLAEAPTDVLVYLVDHGLTTPIELLRGAAPDKSDESKMALAKAMGLLAEMDLAEMVEQGRIARATPAGMEAVRAARARGHAR